MKLETLKRLQTGNITNIKIKNFVDKLVKQYSNNDTGFREYSREEILNTVVDECIIDATNNSDEMLGIKLNTSNIEFLKSMKVDSATSSTEIVTDLPF
jgi:hypothetical protein